jgi:methyl-accepting chemotaxis protein
MTSPTVTRSSWLQPKSLKTKLLFSFLVLGMLPMTTIGILAYRNAHEALHERSGQRMQSVSIDLAEKIDRNLFERYGDVQAFAFNPMAQETPEKMTEAANYYMLAYGCYDLMIIADTEGKIVATNTVTFDGKPLNNSQLIGRNVKGEAWYENCISGRIAPGSSYIEDMKEDRDTADAYQRPRAGADICSAHSKSGWHDCRSLEQQSLFRQDCRQISSLSQEEALKTSGHVS